MGGKIEEKAFKVNKKQGINMAGAIKIMPERTAYAKLRVIMPAMTALLAAAVVLAVAVGAVYVPFGRTVKIILAGLGIIHEPALPDEQNSIIWFVRLPRVIAACFAGGALASCGAVMQGMFRNPMADPGILGVSSGAGLGALFAISLGFAARSIYFLPAFAAAGAFLAAGAIYVLSLRKGKIQPLTLILSGMAISTLIGAFTQLILANGSNHEVRTYIFWVMGGLNGIMWEHVRLIAAPVAIMLAALMPFSRDLNILLLGEEEAQSVGLNPSYSRKLLLLLVSLITAAVISVCGPIGFIGLIVPHILRLMVGPDHRVLIPSSMLGGSIFLVCCDILARLPPGGEISVGIITAMLGAPYFLYLLIRAKKEGEAF